MTAPRKKVACPQFLLVLVCATGCREWPEPEIVSVVPAEMSASATTPVEVRVAATLASTLDYADGTADVDDGATLRIGPRALGEGRFAPGGVFSVVVPTVFEPGAYDVSLTLEDGREAVLPAGLSVLPGTWPEGYSIDPIGPQQRLIPFDVVIRAQGPNAATFRGNVRFEVPAGASVGPAVSETFVDGTLTQRVVLDSPRGQEILIVTDINGSRASSDPFELR